MQRGLIANPDAGVAGERVTCRKPAWQHSVHMDDWMHSVLWCAHIARLVACSAAVSHQCPWPGPACCFAPQLAAFSPHACSLLVLCLAVRPLHCTRNLHDAACSVPRHPCNSASNCPRYAPMRAIQAWLHADPQTHSSSAAYNIHTHAHRGMLLEAGPWGCTPSARGHALGGLNLGHICAIHMPWVHAGSFE